MTGFLIGGAVRLFLLAVAAMILAAGFASLFGTA